MDENSKKLRFIIEIDKKDMVERMEKQLSARGITARDVMNIRVTEYALKNNLEIPTSLDILDTIKETDEKRYRKLVMKRIKLMDKYYLEMYGEEQ